MRCRFRGQVAQVVDLVAGSLQLLRQGVRAPGGRVAVDFQETQFGFHAVHVLRHLAAVAAAPHHVEVGVQWHQLVVGVQCAHTPNYEHTRHPVRAEGGQTPPTVTFHWRR